MEDLTQLMALIDENSKILPEGDYLKMCNTMKNIFNKTSRSTPPTVVPQRAPFAVYHIPDSDPESDSGSDSDSGDLPFLGDETKQSINLTTSSEWMLSRTCFPLYPNIR